jgi:Cu-Zn family superoxide dismutase
MRLASGILLSAVLLLGTTTAFAQPAPQATAEMRDANGQVVGTATITQEGNGIRVALQGRNMPPGQHGIHFHEVGRCDPPGFMSAGEHYNPTGRQHGLQNPQGPHAGDLPNLTVAANGTAQYNAVNNLLTLGSGQTTLFDADGSALIIHANADDNVSDPAGNSGGRIACGVVQRAAAGAQPAPVQAPRAQPRTGDAAGLAGAVLSLGATVLLVGLGLRRRRR